MSGRVANHLPMSVHLHNARGNKGARARASNPVPFFTGPGRSFFLPHSKWRPLSIRLFLFYAVTQTVVQSVNEFCLSRNVHGFRCRARSLTMRPMDTTCDFARGGVPSQGRH
jgi:hypothetical protein